MAENDPPTRRNCGTMEVHERLLRTVPGYMEARAKSENHALRAMAVPFAGRTGCTKVPVVVHVVHKTAAQNISDAQIQSQLDVLNEDFRMENADVSSVPSVFQTVAADSRITFELATTDADGNPTDGITRTKTDKTVFSATTDDIKAVATDGADAWPADKFLNIWVAPRLTDSSGNALLGYAQFPGGPAATDGVVILHSAFGTTGTAAAPFDRGRTTTHEIGHWLNLRHIWGDDGNGCSGSDFVSDTPNQGGPNFGTPAFPHVSCGNGPDGDLFVNYMDYVDDAAMVMFTAEQVVRMQAALDSSRSSIGSTAPCAKFPVKDPPKDLPKEFPKDLPKEFPKDFPKEFPKDPPKDFPKDWPKDLPKDLPKDPPKDFPKDPPKDWPKDPPKDPPKDFPKDPPKDWPKDPPKDWPKDPPKDLPKDPPKDFPKDPPKDFPKDPPKDFPKDHPKDLHKEFAKDFPQDPTKSTFDPPKGILDPPKGLLDPPKGILDPPKGLLEPPIDLLGGGMPFVLATPVSGGPFTGQVPGQPFGHASGQALAAQQRLASALASACAQLLTHYAMLYGRGMLDAAGLAAWQQAAAMYQELTGAGGSAS